MFNHERSLVRKYEGRPFVLLGIDEDDKFTTLREAQQEHHLNWRSWWDDGHLIASQWKVEGLPTLFLLDGKGVVRWHDEGVPNEKKLEDFIERLVKETEKDDIKQASLRVSR